MTTPIKNNSFFDQQIKELKDQVAVLKSDIPTTSIYKLNEEQANSINLFGRISVGVVTFVVSGLLLNRSLMISIFRAVLRL